jgi:hypothetical protein
MAYAFIKTTATLVGLFLILATAVVALRRGYGWRAGLLVAGVGLAIAGDFGRRAVMYLFAANNLAQGDAMVWVAGFAWLDIVGHLVAAAGFLSLARRWATSREPIHC